MAHKIVTTFSIFLASILLMSLVPHLSAGSMICVILLTAGGAVLYREVSALAEADARQTPAVIRARPIPTPARNPEGYPGSVEQRVERRLDGIELRPDASVEQIAHIMVSTSFRQASRKYHPDHGGSTEMMARIIQARNLLLTNFRRY
jgi:hypothetical protein